MRVPLPEPDTDTLSHSAAVAGRVLREIEAAGGFIPFSRYLDIVLYAPGLGYYSAGARKLGPGGDFTTAPEAAPLFSRCLAVQCADVMQELGASEILEFGAGTGSMAADLLDELARQDSLPSRYWILDVSADLRERQRRTLEARVPALMDRVRWLDQMPENFSGVMLANEVLDAIPFERFLIRDGTVRVLGVGAGDGGLELAQAPAGEELVAAVRRIELERGAAFADGYVSEICLRLGPWLGSLAAALARGVALLIDYGLPRRELYSAERCRGTMLCHYRHRYHEDPLFLPGQQDITAWVDFTAVAEAGESAGFDLCGYTTQAHFLFANGLTGFMEEAATGDLADRLSLAQQARLLTLPGEMGERFKVLALGRGYHAPLRGFGMRDLRHTL